MKTVTAIPAYGRDYTSKQKVLDDFFGNSDFNGVGFYRIGYFNFSQIDQLKADGFTGIEFRYNKERKVFIYKI
jgi:hypothetical protein